jgi:hypothetical protein
LVLDNAETVMQAGDREGGYQPGYEGYGQLLRCVGETPHQSCLLITSREKPKGLLPEKVIACRCDRSSFLAYPLPWGANF